MITFSKFGQHGNLGNQLFQYAAMIGLSKKYGHDLRLPQWKYSQFFENEFTPSDVKTDELIKEPAFHYTPDFWAAKLKGSNASYDILGWLQSEKYWAQWFPDVKKALAFKPEFIAQVKEKLKMRENENTIAISIRRGDYVDNPNYELLPPSYYIGALHKYFDKWESQRIYIFSDDLDYCKAHFAGLTNVVFADSLSDIEQLCAMAQCTDFIIANSTFSWWGAYLATLQGNCLRVIRPAYLFAGKLLQSSDWKDHYPVEWTVFDHKKNRIDLRHVTFTIPVSYDHNDRRQNLELSVQMLLKDFDTNIIIMEQGRQPEFSYMARYGTYRWFHEPQGIFHRTKMLNEMARMATTPVVVNWDADIIIPPVQILQAVKLISSGKADVVYPYDGRFARVHRQTWFNRISKYQDAGIFGTHQFDGMKPTDTLSDGGAVIFNKESFVDGGMENEYFLSYGPEDRERFHRFQKLGFRISRINGPLYHLDHWRGQNSTAANTCFRKNKEEFEKIKAMDQQQLTEYVNTWPWPKRPALVVSEKDQRLDVVIPLGNKSPWKNNELRYALRSIQKNLVNYRNIIIVGEDPGFLTTEPKQGHQVMLIPFPDRSKYNRGKNIFEKILRAGEEMPADKKFLFSNDDIFLLKKTKADEVPYYHKGSLKPAFQALRPGDPYLTQLQNTYTALKKAGLPVNHYDIHYPVVYRNKNIAALLYKYDWGLPYGFGIKSLYSNTWCVDGRQTEDLKISEPLTRQQIEERTAGRDVFSIGDAALNTEMKNFLYEKFPEPSRWEK